MTGRCVVLIFGLILTCPAMAQETSMDHQLDFSLAFQTLNDQDMESTYSYLPMVGVGYSFIIAPELRTYLGLRYGWKSGDPYHDVPGFEGTQDISVKTVPFLIGLKFNLARSTRVRAQLGLALVLAYTREQTPPRVDYNGNLDDSVSSDILGGYMFTFAPEWLLGQGRNSIGLEIGVGGTQGRIDNDTSSHEIDLTGFSARLYYVLGLGGN